MPSKKKAKKEEAEKVESVSDKDSKTEDQAPKYVTVEKGKDEEKSKIEHEMSEKEKKDESETKEELPKTPTTGVDKPSSFSLLDADKPKLDKSLEAETKEAELPSETKTKTEEPDTRPASSEKEKPSPDSGSDWLKDASTETVSSSEDGEKKGKGKKMIVLVVILVVIAGIVAGGVYYYKSNVQVEPEPEVTLNEEPAPEPTKAMEEEAMEEEVDVSEYSVSILNGSGVPGEAGKVETLLSDSGFTEIETGNADSYDFLETQVSVKADTPSGVFKEVEKAIGSDYKVVQSEDALDEDSSFDVIIIVGSEEPEEAEETPTPTSEEE